MHLARRSPRPGIARCTRPALSPLLGLLGMLATSPLVLAEPPSVSAVADAVGTQVTRLATTEIDARAPSRIEPRLDRSVDGTEEPSVAALDDPIVRARRLIAESRAYYYAEVRDYTCVFYKREQIDGRLTAQHVMTMKARTRPQSVYLKFHKPAAQAGREAIHVAGRHDGKVLVHDVGLGKLLAGTLALDPRGARAMQDCRHPITEAGLGHLLDTLEERWRVELKAGESRVSIRPGVRVGDRPCTMIVSNHPERHPSYLFHEVRVYLDDELGLPIRFEAYDWPRRPGLAPELLEEYTYTRLTLNVGLTERDFDVSNPLYSFGRF